MLKYLKQEANYTVTENGALTHLTTESDCLDLFATIGALRRESESEIINRFIRAYTENRDIAMKLLFFARDIRGGLGERRVFRVILKWLADNEPASVRKNLAYVAEYGRFDDLLALMGTSCEKDALNVLKAQFEADNEALKNGGAVSLLAKWLPSVNASNGETVYNAKKVAKHLGMNDASYRKALVALRARIKIVENNLREKDYTFDYSKQPSKAMYKYRKAFIRNDEKRYNEFLENVKNGTQKLNAGTLMPYEIIAPILEGEVSEEERTAIDVTWRSQTDFGNDENALVVIDGSASMYGYGNPTPAMAADLVARLEIEKSHDDGGAKNKHRQLPAIRKESRQRNDERNQLIRHALDHGMQICLDVRHRRAHDIVIQFARRVLVRKAHAHTLHVTEEARAQGEERSFQCFEHIGKPEAPRCHAHDGKPNINANGDQNKGDTRTLRCIRLEAKQLLPKHLDRLIADTRINDIFNNEGLQRHAKTRDQGKDHGSNDIVGIRLHVRKQDRPELFAAQPFFFIFFRFLLCVFFVCLTHGFSSLGEPNTYFSAHRGEKIFTLSRLHYTSLPLQSQALLHKNIFYFFRAEQKGHFAPRKRKVPIKSVFFLRVGSLQATAASGIARRKKRVDLTRMLLAVLFRNIRGVRAGGAVDLFAVRV